MFLPSSRRTFLTRTLKGTLLAVLGRHATCSAHYKFSLSGTVFETVGRELSLDPILLYSIACVESAVETRKNSRFIKPYPWTIRSADGPYYGRTRKDAENHLRNLRQKYKSIDVGLMQINLRWHGHKVKRAEDLLDPYTNVLTSAQILNQLFISQNKNAYLAVGFYHSRDRVKAARYAKHVFNIYLSL